MVVAAELAAGQQEEQSLRQGGFADNEIEQWKGQTARDLSDAGFSGKEVGEYFGVKEPDMTAMRQYFEKNLAAHQEMKAAEVPKDPAGLPKAPPKAADGFFEAMEAGWQMSTFPFAPGSLVTRGKAPDVMVPENAPMASRIAFQLAETAGDVPVMVAGYYGGQAVGTSVGGTVGSAVPAIGTAAGAVVGGKLAGNAGAFALPTAIRETLMQHYEKGDIQDFGDFYERSSAVFWKTLKAGVTGAATGGAGLAAGKALSAAPALAQTLGTTSAELATMVSVGKGLEGQVPSAQDFIDGAIVIGALHGISATAGKLRETYAKTGLKPEQVLEAAKTDPTIKQDLLSTNVEVPKALESPVENSPENSIDFAGKKVTGPEAPATEGAPATPAGSVPTEAAPSPPKQEGPPRTEAETKILSQVGEKPEVEGKKYSVGKAYTDFVDRLNPWKNVDPESYQSARMANDFNAKTKHVLENGTIDFATLEKNGKGLKEIIEPHKEDLDGFQAYLISKRALEVEGRGLKSGFDVEAAKEVVKSGSKYEKAANELVEFQNRNLKYLQDSGVLSKESFSSLVEAGKSYIPFSRIIDPETGGGKAGKPNSLKSFKGSDKQIQSPLVSVMENTQAMMKMGEKNRAVLSLVKNIEKTPDQALIERVPDKLKPIEVKEEEVRRALGDSVPPEVAKDFTVFRNANQQALGKNEFQIFRDGKREVYRTDPDLAQAIKSLDGDQAGIHFIFKIARTLTQAKKLGIALTPDFVMRNFMRDQLTAGTFTQEAPGNLMTAPFHRAAEVLIAMGDLMKHNESYWNWMKSGGGNGTFLDLNQKYLETKVFELDKKTDFLNATWNVAKKPMDWVREAGELAEQATRLAEFKRISEGESSGPKVFEGGFSSREVTVDFQRIGAKMSAMNAITAFLNVSIQGLDRTGRAIKEDPAGTSMKAATYITMPSVLLWWANHNDERYKELPAWEKNTFWHIMNDKWVDVPADELPRGPQRIIDGKRQMNIGTVIRLPKPQELGILFGSLPERILDVFFEANPHAFNGFSDTIKGMIPNFIPDAAAPIAEQYMGKSFFTGNRIVPHSMEGILPAYQYTENTTNAAKMLGSFIRTLPGDVGKNPGSLGSPIVVENYARAWTGTLGMYALQLADKALTAAHVTPDPKRPNDTLADTPFVKAFISRYPSAGAQSLQDFYETYTQHKVVFDTLHFLGKGGNFADMQKEMSNPDTLNLMMKLEGLKDGLAAQTSYVRMVIKNPELSPTKKREQIDGIYQMMIEQAKMGNQFFEQFEKLSKEGQRQ